MTIEFWRNVSVVWIALHMFILCLLPLGIAFLAARGMNWALGKAPVGFHRLQEISGRVRAKTEDTALTVTETVGKTQSRAATMQAKLNQTLRRRPSASFRHKP